MMELSDRNNSDGDFYCGEVEGDTLAYIKQLERERDALVKLASGQCRACKHKLTFSQFEEPCCKCRHIWPGHGFESHWEWRGVEEDDHERTID